MGVTGYLNQLKKCFEESNGKGSIKNNCQRMPLVYRRVFELGAEYPERKLREVCNCRL